VSLISKINSFLKLLLEIFHKNQVALMFSKDFEQSNLPRAVDRTNYSGLNGFDSRCCAYGIAVAILAERLLPDGKGQAKLMFPKDFAPRR